jgi:hypothetical protein
VLNLYQPISAFGVPGLDGYVSPNPSITYSLFDFVSGGDINAASGIAAYQDLAEGDSYGQVGVTAASNGGTVSVAFNAAGLAALNSAVGGTFSFGGAVLDAAPSPTPEPAAWAMMLIGFGAVGAVARQRRRVAVRFA